MADFTYTPAQIEPGQAPVGSLRALAAADRASFLSDDRGLGEEVRHLPNGGGELLMYGFWSERLSDERMSIGIGARGAIGGVATLILSLDAASVITRADRFIRTATSETWNIEQAERITGVGWRITLVRADVTKARVAR